MTSQKTADILMKNPIHFKEQKKSKQYKAFPYPSNLATRKETILIN